MPHNNKFINSNICVVYLFSKLAKALSYNSHKECLCEAALLDIYVAAYWYPAMMYMMCVCMSTNQFLDWVGLRFGKEQKFNNQQLSGFFTVLHKLIGNCKS